MLKLNFEKIYSTKTIGEYTYIGIPLPKDELKDVSQVTILDKDNHIVPSQSKATGYWSNGSIKWLFVRFEINLEANSKGEYYLDINAPNEHHHGSLIHNNIIDNNSIKLALSTKDNTIFDYIYFNNKSYKNLISYPKLIDKKGNKYNAKIDKWHIVEQGPLYIELIAKGNHHINNTNVYAFEIRLAIYLNKSEFEIGYKIINTTNDILEIDSLIFESNADQNINKSTIARSNYKTSYKLSENGEEICDYIDSNVVKFTSNEHNAEVFYGTFFGDYISEDIGVCTSIYQPYQNYPKAFNINNNKMDISIIPKDIEKIVINSGMAREQKMLLMLHLPTESIDQINDRSIRYQMPNKPSVSPEVFERSNVFSDVFVKNKNLDIELYLSAKADEHARCYGMLNWGDSADIGYTNQGRGNGELVWTNNEYDYPHACVLQYIRTGTRRFLDYAIASSKHQIDVDICHYSDNPLIYGGQYEHTISHTLNGKVVCSHQWVEGLLEYYHLTGNIEGLNAAIGIGDNVLRLLDTAEFKVAGETNARETGWALRTLTALYIETNDNKWLSKCEDIVNHFKAWKEKDGIWLSTYTDNSKIRVVFMISVAIGSLMRYYRVKENASIKEMILDSIDDLIENAMLDNGLFYYKELPSLKRNGNNPLILEALTIAYELTNDIKFLKIGLPTLKYVMSYKAASNIGLDKKIIGNTVMNGNTGTKSFAQLMIPVTTFYKQCSSNNLI